MHPELQEALDFHHAIVAEAGKALVGYETEKALANVVLMSEIPTSGGLDYSGRGAGRGTNPKCDLLIAM